MAIENTLILAASEALSIGVDSDYVRFIQEDAHGENDHYVTIPRLAFPPVLNQLMKHFDRDELVEIQLCLADRLAALTEVTSHE